MTKKLSEPTTVIVPDAILPSVAPVNAQAAQFVEQITASWRRSAESLIETAHLIRKAQVAGLEEDVREQLERSGVMSDQVFKMFKRIAESTVLMDARYLPKLPAAYNTLYHLALLEPKTLKQKLDKSEIDGSTTLQQARAMKDAPAVGKRPSQGSSVTSFSVGAKLLKAEAFQRALARLASREGLELTVRVATTKRLSQQSRRDVAKALSELAGEFEIEMAIASDFKP